MIGRKLIKGGVPLTPEQAADESVDLRKLENAAAQQKSGPAGH
jgi:hypothetical protein